MALSDKDRIFTNLYGLHDWQLPAARGRGHWDGTEALIERGATGSSRRSRIPASAAAAGQASRPA